MKLPRDVNGPEAVRALHRLGFDQLRQTGSHVIMRREGRTVVVPMHRPIKPGTLRGLIEQAGVTVEAFRTALWLSLRLSSGREPNAYMIRLRHERPEWRKMLSRRMRNMDGGKTVSAEELRRRLGNPRSHRPVYA